jgi:hypothetical protein
MAAPNLNGCETALNTISNCGGCGRACSSSHVAQPQCAFGVCISTCQSGFVNCSTPNAPTPDDGCECAGSACCSGACQTAHTNGLGQNFYDCVALDTYNVNQATEACNAHTGGGTCAGFNSGTAMNTLMSVCKPATDPSGASGVCACWAYSGTGNAASAVGHVYQSSGTGGDTGCLAPTSTSLTWT